MRFRLWLGELARYVVMAAAFLVMSAGIVAMINTGVGTPPWDVLHLGLSRQLPFSYGPISQFTGLVLILLSLALGIKPRLGTVLNMLLIGWFVDLISVWNLLPFPVNPVFCYLQVLAGTMAFACGTSVYILLDRGTGPRDSFMVALSRLTGLRIGLVRTLIEIAVAVGGFLLGGPLGVGTVIFALTVGPFMEFFFKIIRYQVKVGRRYYYRLLARRSTLPG